MADLERMYIDGEWMLAEGGATFDVKNPADASVVARVANGGTPEIQRAVTAAHAAFREWSGLAAKDRGSILLKIQELMQERRDELARLVTLENGKPFEEAKKEVQFRSATSAGSPRRRGGWAASGFPRRNLASGTGCCARPSVPSPR